MISFFPSIKTLYVGIPGFGSSTEEQVDLFQRRYEEGFNLYTDLCYVNWLEIHHPEALPNDRYDLNPADDCVQSVASHYANVSPLCPANAVPNTPGATPGPSPGSEVSNSANDLNPADDCVQSVASHYANVSPLCPANAVPSTPGATPGPSPGSEASNSANDLSPADDCVQSVASHFANVSPLCPANAVPSTPGATPGPSPGSEASNSATKAASSKDSSQDVSVVSKYLKVPIESTPQCDKRCSPRAKLLTSIESLRTKRRKNKRNWK